MKKFSKLFLMTAGLFFACNVFAAKDNVTMNINFINMTFAGGNAFVFDDNYNVTEGPSMQRNGGSVQWSPSLADSLYGMGIAYPNGMMETCAQGYESIVVNPEIYKGDLITVVMSTNNSTGNLNCTCTGSACDISLSHKH